MRNLVDIALLVAVALLLAGLPGAAAENDDGKREEWVAKYQELQVQHARLEHQLDQARQDYSRGRSSKHLRGEGKAGLLKEIARLEDEFAKVDQELEDFPDLARKNGALPGWFRDIEPPTVAPADTPQPAAAAAENAEPDRSRSSRSLHDRRDGERERRRLGRD